MVSYVMYSEQISRYASLKKDFAQLGLPLHPNPLWNSTPSDDLKRLMSESLPKLDLHYRSGSQTKGQSCIYPMLAYRTDQYGKISVGCFPNLRGDLFRNIIPENKGLP